MHADSGHHGGLPAIKDVSPTTLLATHSADRKLIEDPEYQHRYNFLAHDHELGLGREGMVYSPRSCKIDLELAGEDIIELGGDWDLPVWHVPGHSDGHLAIYDGKNHAAFTSDAVQTLGYPTISGKMAFAPTYFAVDGYLATIRFFENHPIEYLFTGHWPAECKEGTKDFLAKSREFVERVDSVLMKFMKDHFDGVTLKEVIYGIGPKLGDWSLDMNVFLQFALYGHMERLEQRGIFAPQSPRP